MCILLEAIIQVFTLLFRASNCSQNSKEAGKFCTFQKRAQKRELPSIQKRKLRVGVNDSLKGARIRILSPFISSPCCGSWCIPLELPQLLATLVPIFYWILHKNWPGSNLSCVQSVYICWIITTYGILGSHIQDTDPSWRNLLITTLDTFKFLQSYFISIWTSQPPGTRGEVILLIFHISKLIFFSVNQQLVSEVVVV